MKNEFWYKRSVLCVCFEIDKTKSVCVCCDQPKSRSKVVVVVVKNAISLQGERESSSGE